MTMAGSNHRQVQYRRTEDFLEQEGIGGYETYGIIALDANGVPVEQVRDVDPDPLWVDAMVVLLNARQVAPEHLRDILCDALGQTPLLVEPAQV